MITFESSGDFQMTEAFLRKLQRFPGTISAQLRGYGQEGVAALASATPVDSSLTANSWGYELTVSPSGFSLTWTNSNVVAGAPIAIMLQYGHGTGTGGYVRGRDYINPAIQPIFDRIADDIWKVVTSA